MKIHSYFGIMCLLLFKIALGQQNDEANLNDLLIAQLDTIYKDDQQYRRQLKDIETKYGRESNELNEHWTLIHKKDSINLLKVQKILDERGWLGPDQIGDQGNATLFMVIQHAPLDIQEKYIPMMREAVKEGKAKSQSLALLEDRIAVRNGQKQLYGSQIGRDPESGEYYIAPLSDPDNVDMRRREMGLGKLQDYISNWGLIWDAAAYKKALPELEAKFKD